MKISVIICTRNRATSLRRALESFVAATQPDVDWELIVVDNASSDETPTVVAAFKTVLPIRWIVEPMAGLSRARNRGVSEARGDYILWTDDDVEVDAEWLQSYSDAVVRFPAAAVFGGRIVPVFQTPPPEWFSANADFLARTIAARDFGNDYLDLSLDGDVIPFGANYAIRAAEQKRFLYDVDRGAGSGCSGVGEETSVVKAILVSGCTGIWVPRSVVSHHISSHRMTTSHVAQWFADVGFAMQQEAPDRAKTAFGVPRWMWRTVAGRYLRYRIMQLAQPKRRWVRAYAQYAIARGQLKFWLRERASLSRGT